MTTMELATFTFHLPVAQVRTLLGKDGEPCFVAADVCAAIGLRNVSQACERLEKADKGVTLMDTPGGPQETLILTEAGLYELVVRSDKPSARPFIRWITHEVLPSIRRTGSYALPGRATNTLVTRRTRWGWQPVKKLVSERGYSGRSFLEAMNAVDVDLPTVPPSSYAAFTYGHVLPTEEMITRAELVLGVDRRQLFTIDVLEAYPTRGRGNYRRA